MQPFLPLEAGNYYHIFNQGVSGTNLFKSTDNFEYFLKLYSKHIDPIANTFAFCLMPNHFHLLIQIKEENIAKPPHQYFSNLFNAYTQAYNKMYKRRGTLFQRPFKRKHVNEEHYFIALVLYIHKNPVHHGFANHPIEWGWSSYLTCLSEKETKIQRKLVLEWFGGRDKLKLMHEQTSKGILLEEIDDL